jgi:predicted phosphatase
MPEISLGDLAQNKLFDVLKPLFGGKKTGKITVKGKEGGELYLELGNITHAKTNSAVGEYAFFFLMGLKAGKALFEPDEVPSERTISISTEQLLLNWSYRKQEWDKLKEVIPSTSAVFRLSLQKNPENKNINADQWNVLALCNGTKTISEIAESLSWDEFKTSKVIFQLVQIALLEKVEDPKPVKKRLVSENFLPTVETELKRVIGPMAPLIMNDKLSDLNETKDSLGQDQALSFVEKLSEEISNDSKKKEFLRIMTDFLSAEKIGGEPRRVPGVDLKL